jgi:hypothetical protein
MGVKDAATAMVELSPILGGLEEAICSAHREYMALDPELRLRLSRRSQSTIINDLMVSRAAELLEDKVTPLLAFGQVTFLYRGYRIRFKMLDRELRPSRIKTLRSEDFLNQGYCYQGPLPLDGPPELTNLLAGYTWNPFRTGFAAVFVVCPDNGANRWYFRLDKRHDTTHPEVRLIRTEEIVKRRVRPKEVHYGNLERRSGDPL